MLPHLVHNDSTEDFWWRGCMPRHETPLTCAEHKLEYHDREVIIDQCVCDTALCNKDMGQLVSTTPGVYTCNIDSFINKK